MMDKDTILRLGGSLSAADYDVLERSARAIKPKNILEIGCRHGTSSMLFATILEETGGWLTCIESDPNPTWVKNMEKFTRIKMIKTYSPWVRIEDIPPKIDYFFIDGDHRTRFAICDYHFFAPFVRVGGRIAFHDTQMKKGNCEFMVNRAINIILEESTNLKLVDENKNDWGVKVFEKTEDF